jgi:hypothetical protein
MLSDTCFDFNSKIAKFVCEALDELKAELDHYDEPPWYVRGEIPAIRRAIAAFDNDPHNAETLIALLRILEKVRLFHDSMAAGNFEKFGVLTLLVQQH